MVCVWAGTFPDRVAAAHAPWTSWRIDLGAAHLRAGWFIGFLRL
jgi:hypothetical protein